MDRDTASAIDTSVEYRIGRDWIKSIALVGLCLAVTAILLWATTITPDGANDIKFRSGAFSFLPFMAPFTLWVTFRLFVPVGALIRVGPDGFVDRRVNSQVIPWSGIRNIVPKGEFISLTLKSGTLETYRFSPSQRLIKWRRKSARPSHLLVASWCVAPTKPPLLDMLNSYHAAHGNA